MTEKERLIHLLLGSEGRKHKNIKFMRGDSADITDESFCREVNHALVATHAGTLKRLAALPAYDQVDIEALVARLENGW